MSLVPQSISESRRRAELIRQQQADQQKLQPVYRSDGLITRPPAPIAPQMSTSTQGVGTSTPLDASSTNEMGISGTPLPTSTAQQSFPQQTAQPFNQQRLNSSKILQSRFRQGKSLPGLPDLNALKQNISTKMLNSFGF